jgi:hypothetical protein
MSDIWPVFALCVFPALALLFFCSFKSKRMVWLAIPASALVFALCYWKALAYYEARGMTLVLFAIHTAAVSAVTAIAALIRAKAARQPQKRTLVTIAAVIGVAFLGFAAHATLSDTSDAYRQIFDRRAFAQLTQVRPGDVAEATAFDFAEKSGGAHVDYHGDMTFFAGLEYDASLVSRPGKELGRTVTFALKNGGAICFTQHTGDEFSVEYRGRVFYVKSPQLLADIT